MKLLDFIQTPAYQALADRYHPSIMRPAVNKFSEFLGKPTTLADVTESALAEFVPWLQTQLSGSSSHCYPVRLRALVRFLSPGSFPRKQRIIRKIKPNAPSWPRFSCEQPPRMTPAEIKALAKPETLLETAYWQIVFPRKTIQRTVQTRKLYMHSMDRFNQYLGRDATLADLNDETVTGWVAWLGEQGLTPQTVSNRRQYVMATWNFLARKRFVPEFPDVPGVVEPDPIPVAWSGDQFTKLLTACQTWEGRDFAGIPGGRWFHALIAVAYDTGARAAEMFAARWDWLDDQGYLDVPAEVRKGKRKPMRYKLHSSTMAILDAIRQPERELIFPLECDSGTFYNQFRKLLKAAGLPADRRRKLHCIRRTFASHLEAAGGDATAALGHSSRAVTLAYLDDRITKKQHASDLLPHPWAVKPETGKEGVA